MKLENTKTMDVVNKKQRQEFIEYWVKYMEAHSDKVWSRQQNQLINSQLKTAKQWPREEYLKMKDEISKA